MAVAGVSHSTSHFQSVEEKRQQRRHRAVEDVTQRQQHAGAVQQLRILRTHGSDGHRFVVPTRRAGEPLQWDQARQIEAAEAHDRQPRMILHHGRHQNHARRHRPRPDDVEPADGAAHLRAVTAGGDVAFHERPQEGRQQTVDTGHEPEHPRAAQDDRSGAGERQQHVDQDEDRARRDTALKATGDRSRGERCDDVDHADRDVEQQVVALVEAVVMLGNERDAVPDDPRADGSEQHRRQGRAERRACFLGDRVGPGFDRHEEP